MIEERAMELVKALRSGKYPQTSGRLRRKKAVNTFKAGFCCLGVACDISKVGSWDGESYRTGERLETGILPEAVKDYFGFAYLGGCRADDEGIKIGGRTYASLWDANDKGVPFREIADYIEENWEAL